MLKLHLWRSLSAALVVFLLSAIAAASLIWHLNAAYLREVRGRAINLAHDHAGALERSIDRALSANYALSALVRQGNGAVRDFDAVAGGMLPLYPGAGSLQLAPGGKVQSIFPLAGNENAIGLDLLNDPIRGRETMRARTSGKLVFFGPFNLVRGGVGAVGWLPVFLDDARGKPVFWGFTSVLIRFPDILEAADFPELARRGFGYELWRSDPGTGKKLAITASSPVALIDPVGYDLRLPDATWTLSIAPVNGWIDPLRLSLGAMLGLLFSLLLAYVAKLMVESKAHEKGLEALVAERTVEVHAREADLNRAQSVARIGSWVLDVATKELRGSAEALRIFGVDGSEPINYNAFLKLVHPDDREAVGRAARASLKGKRYDIEYRILAGAAILWVHSSAELSFDADGKLLRALGTVQDITERKRAADLLHEGEARYRQLFEGNPQPMWVYDLETLMFLAVNDAAVAHYGYSRDEFETLSILDIRPPEEAARLMQRIAAVRKDDVRDAGLWRHRTKNGRLIDVEITAHTLDFAGRRAQVVHANDVTERLQAERDLRASEERYRALTDLSSDWYWEQDSNSRFTLLSKPNTGQQEVEPDTFLGKTRREAPGVVWDEPRLAALEVLVEARQPFRDFEIGRTYRNGPKRYVQMSGEPVFDETGCFTGYRGVGKDITERKLTQEALHESEARFRSLTEMSSDWYWEQDRDFRLSFHSSGFAQSSGTTSDKLLGKRRWEEPNRFPLRGTWDDHRAVLEAHQPFRNFEYVRIGDDGAQYFVSLSGVPVFDAAAKFSGYRGVGTNITERKRHEGELERMNEELEQRVAERTRALEVVNDELEAFSYSVSHDLRAPLRAIQGFSRVMETQYTSQIDEQGRDMLRRVGAGAVKMGRLIDDLLNLSRISRQTMQVGPVDLSALARELGDELHAGEPGRRVEWVIAPQVLVAGDPGLLRLVLQNLIGNAWKYSSRRDDARIEFGVAEKDGRPAYFVRDNGAGFDMANVKKLFGAFQRLHSAAEFPGSGIGLATVARILHRHGGTAWAEARVGEGATFYFSLG